MKKLEKKLIPSSFREKKCPRKIILMLPCTETSALETAGNISVYLFKDLMFVLFVGALLCATILVGQFKNEAYLLT